MRVTDPGHAYFLNEYSGNPEEKIDEEQPLIFMHRIGDKYPGNQGNPYCGTNCQEVIRALIDRCIYLNIQIYCKETEALVSMLRECLLLFELRAAREHGLELPLDFPEDIETVPTCRICGHIVCRHR